MGAKHGNLSINSDNIFPIIKKWLYSDHDIFVRELVSNGCDAITKLKKLEMMGEYTFPDDYKNKIDELYSSNVFTYFIMFVYIKNEKMFLIFLYPLISVL